MSFSYDPANLSTARNKIRLLIRDTNSTSYELEDEELDFFDSEESSIYGAAALACDSVATKYANTVGKAVGKLRIDASDKHRHWVAQADRFRDLAGAKGSPRLYAGGISKSDKETQEVDSDRVEPVFTRDMDEIPGSVLASSA